MQGQQKFDQESRTGNCASWKRVSEKQDLSEFQDSHAVIEIAKVYSTQIQVLCNFIEYCVGTINNIIVPSEK